MPAILNHASNYPPHEWYLILKPIEISEDQLWNEMTKAYEIRTAARHLRACTTIKDTITKANLCMLRPEARKHLDKEASIKRKPGFEDEVYIDYIRLSIEQYDEDMVRMFKKRMQTIPEGEELRLKAHETSISAKLPLNDVDKFADSQLFINNEMQNPPGPRVNEISQQQNQVATQQATVDDPRIMSVNIN